MTTSDLPTDWSIPTFREIADPATIMGVAPDHLSFAVILGGLPSVFLMFLTAHSDSIITMLFAILLPSMLMPTTIFLLRYLYKIDPNWIKSIKTHRYPPVLYLGK